MEEEKEKGKERVIAGTKNKNHGYMRFKIDQLTGAKDQKKYQSE